MAARDRTRRISVARNGYTLAAELIAAPAPDAACVVFGNSLLTDMTIWEEQVASLSEHVGLLRYDQAGHGGSDLPPRQSDFDDLGADLLAAIDAAGIERVIYVGVSMGVPTGLAAHRLNKSRFAGLVLCDGQCRTAPGGAAAWAERIADAEANGIAAFASATAERWLTAGASGDRRARLESMMAATGFDGFRHGATALMNYDYSDELARIECPTLLIAGAEDGAMPASMASMLRPAIAGAEMVVIPDAGHVPCFEQPQAFTAALEGFLARIGGAARANDRELHQ
jgi:3-oxoadipate enol-lactonase